MDWIGELSPRASVLATSSGLPMALGHFRCAPGDPVWDEVNHIGGVAHVVFPRAAVQITPLGGSSLTADANRVILYDANQEYRRALLDPRGDDCLFVAISEAALEHMGRDTSLVDRRSRGFVAVERPCPAPVYVSLQVLRTWSSASGADQLAIDELLVAVVAEVLGADTTRGGPDVACPVAEAVRSLLAHRYTESLDLAAIAMAVGMSPYHLHRRFRTSTGWTIHGYRDHLRLREGLARVMDGADDLAILAHELGYTSHSHFTARFRAAFGVTPTAARRSGRVVGARS